MKLPQWTVSRALGSAVAMLLIASPLRAQTGPEIVIRLSTTNQTTNTVATGAVVKNLGLLETELKTIDRLKGRSFRLEWSNFTTGPQMTNGMLGDKLDFAIMGDYPLVVNAMTLAPTANRSRLIATTGYNLAGSGNSILVRADSPIRTVKELTGKTVAVAFGSAAYGMLLKALRENGVDPSAVTIVNQGIEVAATNLRESKIDAMSAYVPFADLLPFRGGVRKLFDGGLLGVPTWHGVVVREAFAKAYPEIVDAYLRSIIKANEWIRRDPQTAAVKLSEWTGLEAEAIYLILGPAGVMRLDPTLRPRLIDALGIAREVLRGLGNEGTFDVGSFVDPTYVKAAFATEGLPYKPDDDALPKTMIATPKCSTPSSDAATSMQIWPANGDMEGASDLQCLAVVAKAMHDKVRAAYVTDQESKSRTFGHLAWYVLPSGPASGAIVGFSRQVAADAEAKRTNGKVVTFAGLIEAVSR